ncbi:GTP-binding protein [Psychrobacter sp. CAL346-MNA-CIBAN-0220]|uniref:CobW family GTP-binding protein n=1 Tax=Psychrobacter sp. CAL346-MNA-CIBAN-0220 TaxID=3140457 RepID=UPI00333122F9
MTTSSILQNVPCTLVTGFLGAGKTTVINQLLATKPADARWALLINEFGRIGIDGALLASAQQGKNGQNNIAIQEVSGGCICCTSQLPLQIALSRLLSEHRPQRLIIEPTGLAHPRELLRQLSAPHWQTALSMRAVITVLSAVQWQQEKYRSHDGFQAHVRAADVVVINRYQQLAALDQQQLQDWITTLNAHASVIWTTSDQGAEHELVELMLNQLTAQLDQPSQVISQLRLTNTSQSRISLTLPKHLAPNTSTTSGASVNSVEVNTNNELPYRYHDQQQGMLLGGWRLPPEWVFATDELQQWLLQLPNWQRIKGLVHTSDGWLQLNFTPDSFTINDTSAQIDSRLEVILLADTNITSKPITTVKNGSAETKNKQQQPIDWEVCDRELMALIL